MPKKAKKPVSNAATEQPVMTPVEGRDPKRFFTRALVESFYSIQHHRIKAANRVGAYVRMGMDEKQVNKLHAFMDKKLAAIESALKKPIEKAVHGHPIWEGWLKGVRGIGPSLAGSLISCIEPIGRFANVSKLWRYAGMDVVDGRAARYQAGQKAHWSPMLKLTCWKIGEQFVRQGDFYREIYDQAKAEDRRKHPVPTDSGRKNRQGQPILMYSDGHIHNRAKRKAVKMFLSHLWARWREIEGLEVTEPYAIAILKHTGKVEAPGLPVHVPKQEGPKTREPRKW